MDLATIIGLILGVICVIWSIMLDGSLLSFWDFASVIITLGGDFVPLLFHVKLPNLQDNEGNCEGTKRKRTKAAGHHQDACRAFAESEKRRTAFS